MRVHFGLQSGITTHKRGYKGDFGENPAYCLTLIGDKENFREIGFICPRKQSLLDAFKGQSKGKINGSVDKVETVVPAGTGTVYCVEVDSPDNTFFTDTFLTHNSKSLSKK